MCRHTLDSGVKRKFWWNTRFLKLFGMSFFELLPSFLGHNCSLFRAKLNIGAIYEYSIFRVKGMKGTIRAEGKASMLNQYEYDSLEFEAASWVLHFWAKNLVDCSAKEDRKKELHAKLERVQRAVAGGIKTGAQAEVPNEIVRDEFNACRASADKVFAQIKEAASAEDAVSVLKSAECEYPFITENGIPQCFRRPLWLGDDSECEVLVNYARVDSMKLQQGEFHRTIAGQVFGCKAETVRKKIQQANRKNRKWTIPNGRQTFLVAMFLINARSTSTTVEILHQILSALIFSGYRAIGVFHLAKRLSHNRQLIQAECDWNAVRMVCCDLMAGQPSTRILGPQ